MKGGAANSVIDLPDSANDEDPHKDHKTIVDYASSES